MPTVTVQSVLNKVITLVQDATGVRYPTSEMIGWLNDGQLTISTIRPDACSRLVSAAMVSGTLQSIPPDGSMLLKVVRNMGANGTTPGRAVRKVPMDLLDGQVPDWHSATSVTSIKHFVSDPRMPRQYYVYPPSDGTTQVEMLYAAPPAPVPILDSAAATYTQSGTTVTVTKATHDLAVNGWALFTPITGTTPTGYYRVTTVTANTFTFTATTATTSGNAAISSVISVDDVYSVPLIDYIAYRNYAKDDDLVGNTDRAAKHFDLFNAFMGSKTQTDSGMNALAAADTFSAKA